AKARTSATPLPSDTTAILAMQSVTGDNFPSGPMNAASASQPPT
ncbi:hypothetical protein GNI_186300, partial [Gregarina niphandrodes]